MFKKRPKRHKDGRKISPSTVIATTFGIGYLPKAPGTWGSIPGVFLAAPLHLFIAQLSGQARVPAYLIAIIAMIALSWIVIHYTEKLWKTHDDSRIVIDETVGQVLALMWFPPHILLYLLGFILFRIFDIFKPGPIGYIDRKAPGAIGTLFDDVVAGFAAAAVLWLISTFTSGLLY